MKDKDLSKYILMSEKAPYMHEIVVLAQISVSAFLAYNNELCLGYHLICSYSIFFLVKAIKYTFFIVLLNKQCLLNNFYKKQYWIR